ncbi:hypothetical protein EYF80_000599 [Liparis tanakae]|uniref:Uncharacterized protein n=1 Tax=Liparis tanakae TaxID=230148 RepID=A0A4Z2JH81_9TELE|nr:hypothetical protein EYF80_000599 [Liparis tanakae]
MLADKSTATRAQCARRVTRVGAVSVSRGPTAGDVATWPTGSQQQQGRSLQRERLKVIAARHEDPRADAASQHYDVARSAMSVAVTRPTGEGVTTEEEEEEVEGGQEEKCNNRSHSGLSM